MPNTSHPLEQDDQSEREATDEHEDSTESEQSLGGGSPTTVPSMTLQKAVDMGEYEPEKLSLYPEWHTLSTHIQMQLIRQGLKNREGLLNVQWAELSNVQEFSKKPELREAMRNIEKLREQVLKDRERLYLEYSGKLAQTISDD